MKINRNNYEIFILDYWEGQLDESQKAELMLFLNQNQDLKEEFENFENISLYPDNSIHFNDKASLKKNIITPVNTIDETNYENYFIAKYEGALSDEQSKQLSLFLDKNPFLQKDFELFENTYLYPDKDIIFDRKKSLKKYPFRIFEKRNVYYTASIAASILIIFAFYFFNTNNKKSNSDIPEISKLTTIQKPIVIETKNYKTIKHKKSLKKINIDYPAVNREIFSLNNKNVYADEIGYRKLQNIRKIPYIDRTDILRKMLLSADANKYVFIEKRTYFIELYQYIELSKELQYAQIEEENKNKSLFQRGISKLKKFLHIENKSQKKFIWTIADLSIAGFNKLTDKDIKLNYETNSQGNLIPYSLTGNDFKILRKRIK